MKLNLKSVSVFAIAALFTFSTVFYSSCTEEEINFICGLEMVINGGGQKEFDECSIELNQNFNSIFFGDIDSNISFTNFDVNSNSTQNVGTGSGQVFATFADNGSLYTAQSGNFQITGGSAEEGFNGTFDLALINADSTTNVNITNGQFTVPAQ